MRVEKIIRDRGRNVKLLKCLKKCWWLDLNKVLHHQQLNLEVHLSCPFLKLLIQMTTFQMYRFFCSQIKENTPLLFTFDYLYSAIISGAYLLLFASYEHTATQEKSETNTSPDLKHNGILSIMMRAYDERS